MSSDPPRLLRRLTLSDAVVIGVGSMVGAGVFAVFGPAAAAAGNWMFLGLALAAGVAWCNAQASAQLATQYPTSGGSYAFGRELLGPWPGFLAGWSFVVGKTASAAAMALTFASYAVPEPWTRPIAIAAVLALTALNLRGITRTARVTRVLVVLSLIALTVVCIIGFTHQAPSAALAATPPTAHGVLQAAGLLFFAFAGYARIATLGEEVRHPERNIPRAITIALTIALAVYVLVGWAALHALGPLGLAAATAPLHTVADTAGLSWPTTVIRIGAAAASLGALLALIAGIGRTALAMAREHDLPHWYATVHPTRHVPYRAEIALAVIVCGVIAVADLRDAIGFSSFGVLVYYGITNAAAWAQPREFRRAPRWLPIVGGVGCLVLVASLPAPAIVAGLIVLAVGVGYRAFRRRGTSAERR